MLRADCMEEVLAKGVTVIHVQGRRNQLERFLLVERHRDKPEGCQHLCDCEFFASRIFVCQ